MLNKLSRYFTTLLLTHLFISSVALASESDLLNQLKLSNASLYSEKYITGGQPDTDDLKNFAKAGGKFVINLRGKNELTDFNEQRIVESEGMQYISIPVADMSDVNLDNLITFNKAISGSNELTLVHCASGNRVGAFFALNAFKYEDKTPEEALQIGKKTGLTRLEARVKSLIQTKKVTKK